MQVDARLTLINRTGEYLEVEPQNIACLRDQVTGTVRHKFDDSGLIRLYPNQSRSELFFCKFPAKGAGPLTIKFLKVHSTGDGDGSKGRSVIAKDLSWTLNPVRN